MRIIKPSTLRRFWLRHRNAEKELRTWIRLVSAARWSSPADVKRHFGVRVDFVKVASGNTLAVFDIANNNYRLITAIHYDYPRIFVLRIFDHQEYDKDQWKDEL
ncbi:MAG TPA: type II toxin-antitoxin system HigB family toxin [Tepidisphaeraceae bacterium]|jgi:mRNA interferase HigB|nr:type II toxin-antitoxin system HigB family toxin [Tepidisphaeraceae bacterium]